MHSQDSDKFVNRWQDKKYVESYLRFSQFFELDGEEWLKCLNVNRDSIVVDLGCGSANILSALSPFISQGIGVDVSEHMIRHAQRKLQNESVKNVELKHSDFRNFTLPFQSVNVVFSIYSLHHIDDQEKVQLFRHVYHMLKPGGLFYIEDNVFNFPRDEMQQLKTDIHQEFRERFDPDQWHIFKTELAGEDFEHTPYLEDVKHLLDKTKFIIQDIQTKGLNGAVIKARKVLT